LQKIKSNDKETILSSSFFKNKGGNHFSHKNIYPLQILPCGSFIYLHYGDPKLEGVFEDNF
jgi:hypothetical protein